MRRATDEDRGVVAQDLAVAEGLLDELHQGAHILFAVDIGLAEPDVLCQAFFTQGLQHHGSLLLAGACEHDLGPPPREEADAVRPNPRSASADHRYLAFD